MAEIPWSEWLDFQSQVISGIPESAGVFMTHAAMKILYIGGAKNLRKALLESTNMPCLSDAKRFRYFITDDYIQLADQLVTQYKEKHAGSLPKCM